MLLALSLSACADSPDAREFVGSVGSAGSSLNGSSLNGSSLNGSSLNGSSLNGNTLAETLESVSAFGSEKKDGKAAFDRVWVEASQLRGSKSGQSGYGGLDFVDTDFVARIADGRTVRVRVTGVTPPPTGSDLWKYRVSYVEPSDGLWYPVCERGDGTVLDAIALQGRWDFAFGTPGGGSYIADPDRFTFACVGLSAIAKCVDLGYAPWRTAGGTVLAGHHQACVRLLRADYCGDGISHTIDDLRVNLYDGVGVQSDTQDWYPEAEWDAAGARCFYPLNRSREAIPCYDARTDAGCGSTAHFATGTLLINETPDNGLLVP